jgi:peptidoglycan hydrolase-like protein with peptidoglycan-binding domain
VQSKDGVQEHTGTWKCDGDHHFTIRSKDESYSSRMNNWDKVIISNDDFPLKFGSQGPRVVKLQKFLNDKLPNNKLTVDGIFDQETEDKLIEFQRKEGII